VFSQTGFQIGFSRSWSPAIALELHHHLAKELFCSSNKEYTSPLCERLSPKFSKKLASFLCGIGVTFSRLHTCRNLPNYFLEFTHSFFLITFRLSLTSTTRCRLTRTPHGRSPASSGPGLAGQSTISRRRSILQVLSSCKSSCVYLN
jgi:hypothetical protein